MNKTEMGDLEVFQNKSPEDRLDYSFYLSNYCDCDDCVSKLIK